MEASWKSSTKVEIKNITVPVFGPDKQFQLYDIYIDDQWIGSARTLEGCQQMCDNHKKNS